MILAESPLSRCSSGMSGLTGKMQLNKAVSPNQKKKPAYVTKKDYDYLILVSSDGIKFHLRRELAYTSGTIRAMMNGPSNPADDQQNVVHFRSIPSHILQKVCHYFLYRSRYENSDAAIPEFRIEPQLSLELLMAANFLDC